VGEEEGEEDSLKEFFVNVKSAKILVSLSNPTTDNYASKISSNVDCTYSHTVRIIQKFEDRGLLESEREGRKRVVQLTEDGRDIAQAMGELIHVLDSAE
jgi:DNA-binding MarR family transcriptional regulator